MNGLQFRILTSFLFGAVIMIAAIAFVVSWKLYESADKQAVLVSDVVGEQADGNCSRPSYAVTCFGDGSRTSWMAWSADLRLSLPVAMTEAAAA